MYVLDRKAWIVQALQIIVLPADLLVVGEVLAAVARASKALTGAQVTTDHLRFEHVLPWGEVLVIYDTPVETAATAGPAPVREPAPTCTEHFVRLPCSGCAADAKARPDHLEPVPSPARPSKVTPLTLARLRERADS